MTFGELPEAISEQGEAADADERHTRHHRLQSFGAGCVAHRRRGERCRRAAQVRRHSTSSAR